MSMRPTRMALFVLALAALACGPPAAAPTAPQARGSLAALGWLSGFWVGSSDDGVTEEVWTEPRGGMLLGVNRTVRGEATVHFEYLRIEQRPDGVVYVASPVGQPTAEFRLVPARSRDGRAVFENLDKEDFPQRIIYERAGNGLRARVEGPGELAAEWRWKRGEPASPATSAKARAAAPRAALFDDGLGFDDEWQRGDAAALGFDLDALDAIVREAERTQSDALLIVKDGRVAVERYFGKPEGPIETMSMTKRIVSIVIGMLLAEGTIASLDAPLFTWFPEWKKDPQKAKVTLRHVLTHTSGIEHKSGAYVLNQQEDRTAFVRKSAVVQEPGTCFSYSNEATQLLSAIVLAASGKPLDEFAAERLFAPLGITDFCWAKDRAGNVQAFYGVALRARDLARIGRLLLNGGKHRGVELVPASWIRESTAPAGGVDCHGLLWWVRRSRGHVTVDRDKLERFIDGVFPGAVALRPLIDRPLRNHNAFWLEAGSLLGPSARAELMRTLHDDNAPLAHHPGDIIGFAADGWLGQQLIVFPPRKLIAVRQHREPQDGSADEAYNKRHGFFDLANRLDEALPH